MSPLLDLDRATLIADRLVTTLRTPFEVDAGTVQLGASLGVVFARGPEEPPESMLRNADVAMYQAKRTGKAGYQVFGGPPGGGGVG